MCGRFNVIATPGLQALLDSLGHHLSLQTPRYNIAPTESVALVADGELQDARWWLTPHWAKTVEQKYSMFNARSERLRESPAFRKPFRSQRGVVPMSSFIEWRGTAGNKQPWKISNEQEALAVAALWDVWRGAEEPLLSCTLVTTAAAEAFKPWHARMPVLLGGAALDRWLDNSHEIAADDPLFAPRLQLPLHLTPVDRAAGNSRNKSAEVMAPAGETVVLPADR